MKEQFNAWLINKGYKESTSYDYAQRVEKVCGWEQMSWKTLAADIEHIVQEYGDGGIKAEQGKKSNRSVRSALRRFKEFLSERACCS